MSAKIAKMDVIFRIGARKASGTECVQSTSEFNLETRLSVQRTMIVQLCFWQISLYSRCVLCGGRIIIGGRRVFPEKYTLQAPSISFYRTVKMLDLWWTSSSITSVVHRFARITFVWWQSAAFDYFSRCIRKRVYDFQ